MECHSDMKLYQTCSAEITNRSEKSLIIGIVQDFIFNKADLKKPNLYNSIAQLACESLGYHCEFELSSTNEYGEKNSEGNWTGFFGLLTNGIYNTSIPIFTPTSERMDDFDFAETTVWSQLLWVTRSAQIDQIGRYYDVVKPFGYRLWITLLSCLLLMSFAITLVQNLDKQKHSYWNYAVNTFLTLFLFLARKGSKIYQAKFLTKMLLAIWGFISIVLVACYSWGLLSIMLRSYESFPFSDLSKFADCVSEQRCQLILTLGNELLLSEIEKATESSKYFSLKMALRKSPVIKVSKMTEAVEKILGTTDKFLVSLVSELQILEFIENQCQLIVTPFSYDFVTFPFRKGDPLRHKFNEILINLHATGIIAHLNDEYKPNYVQTCMKLGRKIKAYDLHLQLFYSPFILMVVGFSVSVLVIVLELFCHRQFRLHHENLCRPEKSSSVIIYAF